MRFTKRTTSTLIIIFIGVLATPSGIFPRSVAEKARDKRMEIISYLRQLRPMVYNFPCEPFPKCEQDALANKQVPQRIQEYTDIKRIYQQGLIFFFEGNFVNSYLRFLETQKRTEDLMEGVSQSYIDRSERMMRDAIEKKDPNDELDLSLVDISLEFGPNSKLRRDFAYLREAPNETRRYDPKLVHYKNNKYRIERNMAMGYRHLGLAKKARLKAITVDSNLAPHQKITPTHRKIRIELYLGSVRLARLSKFNAEFIYKLKYPYDNYGIDTMPDKDIGKIANADKKVPTIENTRMNWIKNPYYLPKKLHPVFDQRIPKAYRRDATDLRNMVYRDEVNMNIKFKFYKKDKLPTEVIKTDGKGKTTGGGGGTPPAKKAPGSN